MQKSLTLAILVLGLALSFARAATVTINFDNITPGGVEPSNFLAAYGIPSYSFSGPAGTSGARIFDYTGPNTIVPSPPNMLFQDGPLAFNQSEILYFNFTPELTQFSLDRIGTKNGGSSDVWHARFYNAANQFLGQFGDNSPLVNAPVQTFTFTAPLGQTIASMQLDSFYTGFATYRNIPVDNFTLTQTPEPSSLALAAFGFVGLAAWGWRRKR